MYGKKMTNRFPKLYTTIQMSLKNIMLDQKRQIERYTLSEIYIYEIFKFAKPMTTKEPYFPAGGRMSRSRSVFQI